jgi:hypothetical protein
MDLCDFINFTSVSPNEGGAPTTDSIFKYANI